MAFEGNQQLPDNPERRSSYQLALASEGFTSGSHSWSVEVGESSDWKLGVMKESALRKGHLGFWVNSWRLLFGDRKYEISYPSKLLQPLNVDLRPSRIRLQLDWEVGKLSFYDPDTKTNLYTFTCTFAERVFPYIINKSALPLRVLPTKVSINHVN